MEKWKTISSKGGRDYLAKRMFAFKCLRHSRMRLHHDSFNTLMYKIPLKFFDGSFIWMIFYTTTHGVQNYIYLYICWNEEECVRNQNEMKWVLSIDQSNFPTRNSGQWDLPVWQHGQLLQRSPSSWFFGCPRSWLPLVLSVSPCTWCGFDNLWRQMRQVSCIPV